MYERLKTEYLCYLMNRAQMDAEGDGGYLRLCEILQDTEFVPRLEMDENRCFDCRELRKDFAKDGRDGDILDGLYGENGTMMELLIVLAERMNYNLKDSEYEAGTGKWFREMLENCGLIMYPNLSFKTDRTGFSGDIVRETLGRINQRQYGWDGEGGLFPLRWPRRDQRYEELLIQENDYIEENYDIC